MKEFNNYISTIVDLAWEEYFIKKDQDEFINVLKYFVDIQQEKLELLRIHIKKIIHLYFTIKMVIRLIV